MSSTVLSQQAKANLRFWKWEKSELPLPLSPGREKELFKALGEDTRNKCTREEIIERNTRLVCSLVRKIKNLPSATGLEFEDLCDAGIIGLIKAVDRFNWKRGHKFSTYVLPLIIQEITKEIYDKSRMVRIPTYRLLAIAKYQKAEENLAQKLKRLPSNQEIARKMKTKKREVNLLKQVECNSVSLEILLSKNGNDGFEKGFFLIDTIEDKKIISPELNAERKDLEEKVIKSLSSYLSAREKRVLIMRFWTGNGKGYPLKKIGKILGGLTRERIRQIQNTALKKLRQRDPQLKELL